MISYLEWYLEASTDYEVKRTLLLTWSFAVHVILVFLYSPLIQLSVFPTVNGVKYADLSKC